MVVAVGEVVVESSRVAEPSSSTPASQMERQVGHQEVYQAPEVSIDTPGPSTQPTTMVVTKTVVKRKKKARQAEIE